MLKEHYFDPNYKFTSKILKNYLELQNEFSNKICLDIPAGNGRNIFLLASHFKHVYGYDISQNYLDEIECYKSKYQAYNITTCNIDITKNIPDQLATADFIIISHFYNYALFEKIKMYIKKGAKMYIETPTCRGGNFLELPIKSEIEEFIKELNIIKFNENECYSNDRLNKSISFTALLEKKVDGSNKNR